MERHRRKPTTATISCACCSCAVILSCLQPSRIAWRCASFPGLSTRQIARAFLVGDDAMEQRITRAKARVAKANVPFEAPSAVDRSERLAAVAAMLYLLFNEGYTAGASGRAAAPSLCDEAIRLCRLLLRLFPAEPEIMALTCAAAVAACPITRASTRTARSSCSRNRIGNCGIKS